MFLLRFYDNPERPAEFLSYRYFGNSTTPAQIGVYPLLRRSAKWQDQSPQGGLRVPIIAPGIWLCNAWLLWLKRASGCENGHKLALSEKYTS
jgi:hypothetical protein